MYNVASLIGKNALSGLEMYMRTGLNALNAGLSPLNHESQILIASIYRFQSTESLNSFDPRTITNPIGRRTKSRKRRRGFPESIERKKTSDKRPEAVGFSGGATNGAVRKALSSVEPLRRATPKIDWN